MDGWMAFLTLTLQCCRLLARADTLVNGAHVGEDSLRSLINSGRLGIGSAAAVGLCIAILHSSRERGSGWGGRRSSGSRLHLPSLSSIPGQATSPFLAGIGASPAAAWRRVQEDLGGSGDSCPTAGSGERQQRRGYVEGWEWGWSGLGSHLREHSWPRRIQRGAQPKAEQDSVTPGGTSRHCRDASAEHQCSPSWRSCWSSDPSQGHISKEKWKHDPGSSVCWTCSGRQSPQGGQRTRGVCRTRDGVFPSVPGEDLLA